VGDAGPGGRLSICPACGGAQAPWRRVPAAEPADASTYLLARCGGCGTASTLGAAPVAAHETGSYRPGAPRGASAAAPLLRLFDRQRLGLLGPPGGRLLDVGAGRGRFVASARAAGWDATGIEPSPRASAPHVRPLALEDARFSGLDAVTLWHVLEHVADPAAALLRVHGWLRPGATILVGVPNLDSLQARIGGPRWFHLDVPRHRTHFTAAGIEAALRAAGFETLRTSHVLAEHNPFGMWQSLVNRATPTPSWLFNLLKRNARLSPADALPTLLAAPLLPVAAALEALAGARGRGGTVAVLARR
jgi:SAM-dependent methyltransferase